MLSKRLWNFDKFPPKNPQKFTQEGHYKNFWCQKKLWKVEKLVDKAPTDPHVISNKGSRFIVSRFLLIIIHTSPNHNQWFP